MVLDGIVGDDGIAGLILVEDPAGGIAIKAPEERGENY